MLDPAGREDAHEGFARVGALEALFEEPDVALDLFLADESDRAVADQALGRRRRLGATRSLRPSKVGVEDIERQAVVGPSGHDRRLARLCRPGGQAAHALAIVL